MAHHQRIEIPPKLCRHTHLSKHLAEVTYSSTFHILHGIQTLIVMAVMTSRCPNNNTPDKDIRSFFHLLIQPFLTMEYCMVVAFEHTDDLETPDEGRTYLIDCNQHSLRTYRCESIFYKLHNDETAI